MSKLDLKKERKALYSASEDEVAEVEVPPTPYLMIDGEGDPNTSPEYKEAVEALFALAYALKFALKKREGLDFTVMPLEGLWSASGGKFDPERKDEFRWTAMIAQPDAVTQELFVETRAEVERKKNLAALPRVRLERYQEGRALQILHVGPYDEEGPKIERLHAQARERGLSPCGRHHEIYLSDPRRTLPSRLKTILRHPVE
jgi:hypothetical protein